MHRAVPALLSVLPVGCQTTVAVPTVSPRATPTATLAAPPTIQPTSTPVPGEAPQGVTTEARVVDIVDGDTIKVEIGGVVYPLRYIGIDSPEVGLPHAAAATATNERLLAGTTVVLETDVNDTDRFDRLLRYVWLPLGSGWLMVNLELVRLGAAVAKGISAGHEISDASHRRPDRGASRRHRGLEGDTGPDDPAVCPAGGHTETTVRTMRPLLPERLHPPYPPDLDSGDIAFRRFAVVPPDPHGFDADLDGIGCESD
jgi:micrococcal nuclease